MLTSFFSLLFSAQAMIWREGRGMRKEGWGGSRTRVREREGRGSKETREQRGEKGKKHRGGKGVGEKNRGERSEREKEEKEVGYVHIKSIHNSITFL